MVDEIPNGPNMIFQIFRERKCHPNQAGNTLPNSIVESFNAVGFYTFLSDCLVSFFWDYRLV